MIWNTVGVNGGFVLGQFLFKIFLGNLFSSLNKIDIANYADDTMPYTSSNDLNRFIKNLEESSTELFKWSMIA